MADLLALSRAEQHRAKRLHVLRASAHTGTFAASVAGVFLPEPGPYLAAGGAAATEALALVWRLQGNSAHQLGERGRRHALIADALARSDAPERANLELRFSSYARSRAHKWADPTYWSSDAAPGPERLRDHVQESAFWSSDLYRWAGRAGIVLLLAVAAVAVFVVFVILGLDEGKGAVTVARIVSVLVLLLIGLDLLSRALGWLSASETAMDVVRAFDRATTRELPGALSSFADYSVATATAPPIPNWVYNFREGHLEAAWRSRSNLPST